MRRVALLVAALLALPLPLATGPAAAAAVPLESLWNLSDIRESAQYTPYTSLPPSHDNQIGDTWYDESNRDLSASADGSRVAYVITRTGHQEVVVRDRSGQYPRVAGQWDVDPDWPASSSVQLGTPVLSPSGDRLMHWWQSGPWGQHGSTSRCEVTALASQPPYLWGPFPGCRPLAFLDEDTLLFQTPGGWNEARKVTGPFAAPTAVTGLPKGLDAVTVGAGGTRIAWVVDGELSVGNLSALPSGAWEVTGARVLAARVPQAEPGWTEVNVEPAFSRDGNEVLWVQRVDPGGNGSIVRRPFDGSAPLTVVSAASSARDHADVASTWEDGLPPGAVTPGSFGIGSRDAGAAAWTPPSDADLSGVLVTLNPPSGDPVQGYAPRGEPVYVFRGLQLGQTYDVAMQAVDRSGRTGPVSHRSFTVIEVGRTIPHVASSVSASPSFPLFLGTPGVPGATYDGASRLEVSQTWDHWAQGSTEGVQPVPASPGQDLVLARRVHDAYGNSSGWSIQCCATVPLDQTFAQFSGGTTVQRAGTWMGTVRVLRRTTDVGRVKGPNGASLLVIGSTCGTCGVMHVFVDGKWVKSVDTWSRVTYLRRWLTRVHIPYTAGPHVVSLVSAGTKGRPDVVLDGFSTSRYAY